MPFRRVRVHPPLALLLVFAGSLTACKKGPLSSSCDAGAGTAALFEPKSGNPKEAAPRVAEAARVVSGAHVVPSTSRVAVFIPAHGRDEDAKSFELLLNALEEKAPDVVITAEGKASIDARCVIQMETKNGTEVISPAP